MIRENIKEVQVLQQTFTLRIMIQKNEMNI
mgnify:FL=1|jgi:hypothetical protein